MCLCNRKKKPIVCLDVRVRYASVLASHQVMRCICDQCDFELTSHMGVELKMC